MIGLSLGLGAALCWGLADVVAARAARRLGTMGVVLGFHVLASALLVAIALASGVLDGVALSDLPFFALVGALGWGSYVAFYGALRIGPISIVSPIVSGYAAVTVVLAVVVLGERVSRLEGLAIALSIGGIVLASLDFRAAGHPRRAAPLGIVLALLTTVLIGAFVFGVSYRSPKLGWLAPIVLARCATLLYLLAQVWLFPAARASARPRPGPGRLEVMVPVVLLALLDTGGYASFNIGVAHVDTSIVAAASAPYALVPVAAGVLLMHERPARSQWAGIAAVTLGLVLLALASR